jgi:hypothetical protein
MPWAERHALGVAEMDATHREFLDMAEALQAASDADFRRSSPACMCTPGSTSRTRSG